MDTTLIILFFLGFIAFAVSTIAGGGGALITVSAGSFLLPLDQMTPVVQLGNFVGRPTRIFIFWKNVRWDIAKWYLPAAWVGAFLGAWLFVQMELEWLKLIVAVFLISTLWQFRFGKKKQSFKMSVKAFAPLGFIVCFISSITGATGAVLNPFYLNLGVKKEELVATKAVNSFLVAIVQLSTYSFFGKLHGDLWLYGLAIGAGAAGGNFLGKRLLSQMSDKRFMQWVIAMMVLTGVVMLWQVFR